MGGIVGSTAANVGLVARNCLGEPHRLSLRASWRFGLWLAVHQRSAGSGGNARIVMLPFRTTGDSARAYFTSGMTSALRTKLASIPGIDVSAATSSNTVASDPAAAAREVNATYALIGPRASGAASVRC